jgi:hypothetical protein
MERHARDNDIRFEQQRGLDQQRMLVVQQVMPHAAPHEFRQDDRDVSLVLQLHLLDVLEQRLQQRAIWRPEDDEPDVLTPLAPLLPQSSTSYERRAVAVPSCLFRVHHFTLGSGELSEQTKTHKEFINRPDRARMRR